MTLRQKYRSLSNPNSVKEMVVTSVYNTMMMEGQTISKETIEKLYLQVQQEKKEQEESSNQRS